MKILTLQIKREFLDQILSGDKKQEFREIRPKNAKKYVNQSEEDLTAVKYDAIQFYNGYAKNRPEVLIKVTKSTINLFVDDNGEYQTYEEDGNQYIYAQMVYDLGKVVSKNNI
mgnify:CR=1 FL=1